jgi:hypothetical protein
MLQDNPDNPDVPNPEKKNTRVKDTSQSSWLLPGAVRNNKSKRNKIPSTSSWLSWGRMEREGKREAEDKIQSQKNAVFFLGSKIR